MAKKKQRTYREGAKGRCYWCGRPEAEHRGGDCPSVRERNDYTVHKPKRHARERGGFGLIR